MSDKSENQFMTAADWIALIAIFAAMISGAVNAHLWAENQRLQQLVKMPKARITQTFECR